MQVVSVRTQAVQLQPSQGRETITRRLDQLVSKRPVTLDSVQGILFRYGYMGLKSEQISGITGYPLTSISCGTKSDVRY